MIDTIVQAFFITLRILCYCTISVLVQYEIFSLFMTKEKFYEEKTTNIIYEITVLFVAIAILVDIYKFFTQ